VEEGNECLAQELHHPSEQYNLATIATNISIRLDHTSRSEALNMTIQVDHISKIEELVK